MPSNEMRLSPCQEAGWKIGDQGVVVADGRNDSCAGLIVTLAVDENDGIPEWRLPNGDLAYIRIERVKRELFDALKKGRELFDA
jgi:hypothetical protein